MAVQEEEEEEEQQHHHDRDRDGIDGDGDDVKKMKVWIRVYEEGRDNEGVERVERVCEASASLFTDLMGDPLCRLRHFPSFSMMVIILTNTYTYVYTSIHMHCYYILNPYPNLYRFVYMYIQILSLCIVFLYPNLYSLYMYIHLLFFYILNVYPNLYRLLCLRACLFYTHSEYTKHTEICCRTLHSFCGISYIPMHF